MKTFSTLILAALLALSGVLALPIAQNTYASPASGLSWTPKVVNPATWLNAISSGFDSGSSTATSSAPTIELCIGIADCNPVNVNGEQNAAPTTSTSTASAGPTEKICIGIADCNPVNVNGVQSGA